MHGMLFTLKNCRFEPQHANTLVNKEKRAHFASELLRLQADEKPIIFLDETNFNLHLRRTQGRSKKGSRAAYITASCKGPNIHVIGAISSNGLIYHEIRRGSFDAEAAKQFTRVLMRRAYERYQSGVVIVIDNAPCHSRLEQILEEAEFAHHTILRLAPYSPMLNAIEAAWSVLKQGVKDEVAQTLPFILCNEANAPVSIREFRLQSLEAIVQRNMLKITAAKCCAFVSHIQRALPGVLQLQDVEF